MTPFECMGQTNKHIAAVQKQIYAITRKIVRRAGSHDESKLRAPELEHFTRLTPLLKDSTYMSDEYKNFLVELKPALDHHYANNRHHPEHFPEGIANMTLVDIVEMFCDWAAACQRHSSGNLYQSILKNQLRFKMGPILTQILINTAAEMADMTVLDYVNENGTK